MKHIPILVALVAVGCSDGGVAPSVSVQSATPDRLTMSDDAANDLTIAVHYDDSDGDLGGGTAEIHDCRADDVVTTLAIPQIASPDLVKDHSPIAGELDLFMSDVGTVAAAAAIPKTCSDLGTAGLQADSTVFCVILVDAAGHRGAGDCTQAVMLFP